MLKPVREKPRAPYACSHPIRHRARPERRDRSPDLLEYRLPSTKKKAKYGYLPRSACGGKVILDRIYWFGLDCKWRTEPKFESLTTVALRKKQPDATLLTLWQDELKLVRGDVKLATRVPLEARRRLAEKYQFLVYSPNRDHMQAAQFVLLKCIDTCKPQRSFSEYARPAIYRAIRDYKNQTETGAVYRPEGSEDWFKYRWARPGQRAMLLASEVNTFSDPTSQSYRSEPDWSFDYRYEQEDDESYEFIVYGAETFDRLRHAPRIELDQRFLKVLDPRERQVIEKRYLISECKKVFKHVSDYLNPGAQLETPAEQADLAKFFGVKPSRISQIEARAVEKLREINFPRLEE